MTFILDSIHGSMLQGYGMVEQTSLHMEVINTSDQNIVFSQLSVISGKVDRFHPITVSPGDRLNIRCDANFHGWKDGDVLRWWIDYSVVEPILYIGK